MNLGTRDARKFAWLSLVAAALSALMFVIGEAFFWGRRTLFAYENVMSTVAGLMAVSAALGTVAFFRAAADGLPRPALVKWTFVLSMLFVVLLFVLLLAIMGMPPLT